MSKLDNVVVANSTKKAAKVVKTAKVAKVLNYKADVLGTNDRFKSSVRTTGTGIKMLLADDKVVSNPALKAFLNTLRKDDAKYLSFDKKVRKIKGNTTPFFILQKAYSIINA